MHILPTVRFSRNETFPTSEVVGWRPSGTSRGIKWRAARSPRSSRPQPPPRCSPCPRRHPCRCSRMRCRLALSRVSMRPACRRPAVFRALIAPSSMNPLFTGFTRGLKTRFRRRLACEEAVRCGTHEEPLAREGDPAKDRAQLGKWSRWRAWCERASRQHELALHQVA